MIRFVSVYFLFSLFFFSFFASGFIDSQDGFQYVAIARRLYYDHTFAVPDVRWPDNVHMSANIGKNGAYYAPSGLGYTLAMIPAVLFEDLLLRLAGAEPYSVFPVQNDWPVLLIASMINAFFGALLVVTLYLYLRSFGIKHQTSVLLSFSSVLCTALWVYTKHVFPHMMFVSFLTLAFYFLRRHALTKQRKFLAWSAVSYGVVVLSYNPSYMLVLPALGLYFLFLHQPRFDWRWVKDRAIDMGVGLLAGLPLLSTYIAFNRLRFGGTGTSGYDSSGNIPLPQFPTMTAIVEGIWSTLFSPGKSVFLFVPILVVLIIFAYKLPKKLLPEVVAFVTLFLTYLWFMGTLEGGSDFLVWHGESSWGPRYMLPVIPLAIVLAANIFVRLNKLQKLLAFWPLMAIGFGVQFLGIVFPYQVRFYELPQNAYIGERKVHISEFGNIIPRYSPVFNTAKLLRRRLKELPSLYNHGEYNLRLYDGFEHPFSVGFSIWREPLDTAYVSFDNNPKKPVTSLSLQVINHQIQPGNEIPAQLGFKLNGQPLETTITVPIGKEGEAKLDLNDVTLQDEHNILEINKTFVGSTSAYLKNKQVLFLQILRINGEAQSIHTLDYPYVSPVSQGLFGAHYGYYVSNDANPWPVWHMHSGIFERTFDFWWLRPLHYWDLPKDLYATMLTLNVLGIGYFGWLMRRYSN